MPARAPGRPSLATAFALFTVAAVAQAAPPRAAAPKPHAVDARPAADARAPADVGLPSEREFTACHRYPEAKRFRLSLRGEVGVADLVAVVGEVSCRTIVVGPAVAQRGGKVTLEVPDLVSAGEVYHLFRSSLEVLGLTVERSGALWKIVDASRAREVARLARPGERTADGDGEEFVTRLLRVEHGGAPEIAEVLAKVRSHDGDVSLFAPGGAIVATDRASNVHRMEDLLRALDVPRPTERLWTLAVHGASATELAQVIDKILEAGPRAAATGDRPAHASGASIALVPVDGAHLVVVVGDEAAYRRVASLAARLDPAETDPAGGQVHVLYLANTNADEMATTLKDLGLTSRAAPSSRSPGAAAAATGASPFEGPVRITADKVANAIVVFASGVDFLMVRDLVARLDLPRRQVYVEAAILDLSLGQSRDVGLSLHGGDRGSDGTTVVGASNSSGVSSLVTSAAQLASMFGSGGLTTGVFGKAFEVAGVSVPSFGVVLKALEQTKDVDVLSRPHLLTVDNTKASLSVGQSIPFQTQSLGAATAGSVPSILSTYQRQDVALRLDLTPHVHDGESVRLEIDGEISDVPDGQTTQPGGPTTNKRTIKTTVVVPDGETVVLGGLVKETESEVVEKVPLLGDIPILGLLFQYRTKQRTKQNLLIALTPYVIRGPEDLRRIFERKQREEEEFRARFAEAPVPSLPRVVDWARQRGLLEQMNVDARRAESEARLLREAERGPRRVVEEGEVREHP